MFRKNRECVFTDYYCLHFFTCDNNVQYRFLNSDISAYGFHIENGIVEDIMSFTFLVKFIFVFSHTRNACSV